MLASLSFAVGVAVLLFLGLLLPLGVGLLWPAADPATDLAHGREGVVPAVPAVQAHPPLDGKRVGLPGTAPGADQPALPSIDRTGVGLMQTPGELADDFPVPARPVLPNSEPQFVMEPGSRPDPRTPAMLFPPSGAPNLVNLLQTGRATVAMIDVSINQVSIGVDIPDRSITEVTIPPGAIFRPRDPTYQDLVVVAFATVRVPATRKLVLKLPTCCTDQHKKAPAIRDYTLHQLPNGDPLRAFVVNLSQSAATTPRRGTPQLLVWQFTRESGYNQR